MDKLFTLKFAFRNLRLHRMRTILTLLGVIIGISTIVFLISFAFGVERLVTREVTGGDAYRLIDVGNGNSQLITLGSDTVSGIKEINGVSGVYGMSVVGAKVKQGGLADEKSMDVSLYGADNQFMEKAGIVLYKGNDALKGNDVVISTSLLDFYYGKIDQKDLGNKAQKMLGQEISLDVVMPSGESLALKDLDGLKFRVIGVVRDDSVAKIYSNYSVLADLGVLSFDQLKVEVTDRGLVEGVRKQIENMGLRTQYVGDTVSQINQVFGIFRGILAAFGVITLLVAVLGMFNILTISLLERIKEVALMKMLGMQRRDISRVFLSESILLGLTGGVVGLLIGLGLGRVVNLLLNFYATKVGGETVAVFYAPWSFALIVVVISALIGFLTGLYPARRAMRVKSLDILRYE